MTKRTRPPMREWIVRKTVVIERTFSARTREEAIDRAETWFRDGDEPDQVRFTGRIASRVVDGMPEYAPRARRRAS